MTDAELAFVRAVNHARARHGVPPVRPASGLYRSAKSYSRWQLRRDYFGHVARIRMSQRFALRGEVLGLSGRRLGPRQTVRSWMHSSSHRATVLHPGMKWAGAGIARGRFGDLPATIVTVHFGGYRK